MEIVELRGEHWKHDDLGNGQRRMTIQNGLHYVDPTTGTFQQTDLRFLQSTDSSDISIGQFQLGYVAKRNRVHALVGDGSTQLKTGLWGARLPSGEWFIIKAVNLDRSATVQISDNIATWHNLWDNCDLSINLEWYSVKFNLILNSILTTTFRFAYDMSPGLDLDITTTPWRVYKQSNNQTVFNILRPIVYDVTKFNQTDCIISDGGLIIFSGHTFKTFIVTVPNLWIQSAQLPVTIDPTLTVNTAAAIDDNAIWDTNANTNYGSHDFYGIMSNVTQPFIRINKDLFRINVSPPSGVVTGGHIKLYSWFTGTNINCLVDSINLTDGNWIEGRGNGGVPFILNGESCWNYKSYNTTQWQDGIGNPGLVSGHQTTGLNQFVSGWNTITLNSTQASWTPNQEGIGGWGLQLWTSVQTIDNYVTWYTSDSSTNRLYVEIDYIVGQTYQTSIVDTININDSISRTLSLYKTTSDSLLTSDNLYRSTYFNIITVDNLLFVDSILKKAEYQPLILNTVSYTDECLVSSESEAQLVVDDGKFKHLLIDGSTKTEESIDDTKISIIYSNVPVLVDPIDNTKVSPKKIETIANIIPMNKA